MTGHPDSRHMALFRVTLHELAAQGTPRVQLALDAAAVDAETWERWRAIDGFEAWLLEPVRLTSLELKLADRYFFDAMYVAMRDNKVAAAVLNVYADLRGWKKDGSPIEAETPIAMSDDDAMTWIAGLGTAILESALQEARRKETERTGGTTT